MNTETKKTSLLLRASKTVERVGNKIPHPLYLFLYLTLFLMIASLICSMCGVSVEYIAGSKTGVGELTTQTVEVVNMFSVDAVVKMVAKLWDNYAGMSNVTLMLLLGMGVALADHTGMFSALIRRALTNLPSWLIPFVLSIVGICSNICVDAGMILSASLGCIIYRSVGRNPWIGGVTGFVSAAAGFTANLMPSALDATLAAITQQVVNEMGIVNGDVNILSNYIFTVVSTLLLASVITILSEVFLPKLFGDYTAANRVKDEAAKQNALVTPEEKKGLRYAGIAALVLVAIVLIGAVPTNGFLRSAEGTLVPNSPLMDCVVGIVFLALAITGVAFAYGSGKIKKANEVPAIMCQGVTDMAPVCLVFLSVSIFLYVFNTSNLSYVVAVSGEKLLRQVGLEGFPLLLVFILVIMVLNIFMYSASTKWLILCPIFVPMFANLGIHPALTQLAYRIGDSCTNSLTPLNACLIATVAILNQYRDKNLNPEEAGVGTIVSGVAPFCFAMQITFIILLAVFMAFDIPIGF